MLKTNTRTSCTHLTAVLSWFRKEDDIAKVVIKKMAKRPRSGLLKHGILLPCTKSHYKDSKKEIASAGFEPVSLITPGAVTTVVPPKRTVME